MLLAATSSPFEVLRRHREGYESPLGVVDLESNSFGLSACSQLKACAGKLAVDAGQVGQVPMAFVSFKDFIK